MHDAVFKEVRLAGIGSGVVCKSGREEDIGVK